MTFSELTRDQKIQLKQRMICDENEEYGAGTSWLELEAADELIDDGKLEERYGGTTFVEGDFD